MDSLITRSKVQKTTFQIMFASVWECVCVRVCLNTRWWADLPVFYAMKTNPTSCYAWTEFNQLQSAAQCLALNGVWLNSVYTIFKDLKYAHSIHLPALVYALIPCWTLLYIENCLWSTSFFKAAANFELNRSTDYRDCNWAFNLRYLQPWGNNNR